LRSALAARDRDAAWQAADAIVAEDPDLRLRPLDESRERAVFHRAIMALRVLQFEMAQELFGEVVGSGGPLADAATRQVVQLYRVRRVITGRDREREAGRKAPFGYRERLKDPAGREEYFARFESPDLDLSFPEATTIDVGDPGGASSRPESTVVRRTPHMDLSVPEPIPPGAEFQVMVYADTSQARTDEFAELITVNMPAGIDRVEVDVWLAGTEHFEILGAHAQTLVIERGADRSPNVTFDVRALHDAPEGAASLYAYFSFNGRPCGLVWRVIQMPAGTMAIEMEKSPGEPPPVETIEPEVGAEAPDLTVEITRQGRDRYCCRVSSPLLRADEQPKQKKWRVGDLRELVEARLDEFVDPRLDPYLRPKSLIAAGKEFFAAAPQDFKEVFWKLVDLGAPLRTIYVVTEEPYLPWELMIPVRKGTGSDDQRQPLGVEFAVGRRITQSHQSPPQHLPLDTSWVIAPQYGGNPPKLDFAEAEAAYVADLFGGSRVDPADARQIDLMLKTEPRSLVHIVCHGVRGPASQAIFVQGTGKILTSTTAGEMDGFKVECHDHAVIFLNACEVGQAVPALDGIGGFARVFSELGAGAVIAPLWSVDDNVACHVASDFYREVAQRSGSSFAEILRDIRKKAYDPETGVDTYAAYCFYGDPRAKA
jgi:hypothetical protein